MKKFIKNIGFLIFAVVLCVIILCSCTANERARQYGGTQTIEVPKGYKVIEATWKDGSELWYLMEPMEDNYVPNTKIFQESSKYGIIEGTVKFVESR